MQPSNFRALVEHMAKRRRRNWDDHRTNSGCAINTAVEINTSGDQRNRSGDAGRDQNIGGQSRD